MILHQADDLHREPKSLARIGVARNGIAPAGDVIGLEPREDILHQVAPEQLLGAHAARDRSLELVVDHGHGVSKSCTADCFVGWAKARERRSPPAVLPRGWNGWAALRLAHPTSFGVAHDALGRVGTFELLGQLEDRPQHRMLRRHALAGRTRT